MFSLVYPTFYRDGPLKRTCECCGKYKTVYIRRPYLYDRTEAVKHSYISCDKCFENTWAGEN